MPRLCIVSYLFSNLYLSLPQEPILETGKLQNDLNCRQPATSKTSEWAEKLWPKFKLLLPPPPSHARGGRPRASDRLCFEGILYLLRNGGQWKELPENYGAPSTVFDRFTNWIKEGIFLRFWFTALQEYDLKVGIEWTWLSMDGTMTKAPLGQEATGNNPTDRGKKGTKRSALVDGRGIPLALYVEGANRHDIILAIPTLQAIIIDRPLPTLENPQNLCLDAGYVSAQLKLDLESMSYQPHVRPRGEEIAQKIGNPMFKARRWVVERCHSWINRFRRLLIRWEKKKQNYEGFLALACAKIIFQATEVFG